MLKIRTIGIGIFGKIYEYLDFAMVSKSHRKKNSNECETAVYHNKKLHSYSIPKNEIIKKNIFITWARRISFILTYHTYAKLILVALLFALFIWWSMEEWNE